MDSVDYTKQMNRKNELFQNDLKNAKRSHKKNLDNVTETADRKVEDQAKSYNNDRLKRENSFSSNVDRLRSDQAKSLQSKSKDYEKTLSDQKLQFHDEREGNLKEWNQKFSGLKDSFRDEIKNRDESTVSAVDNNAKNMETVQRKSAEAVNEYKSEMDKNAQNFRASYNKERKEIEKKNQAEKRDLLSGGLEKQQKFREYASEEMGKVRKNQETEYLSQREDAADRFKSFSNNVNEKQANFRENELDRVRDASKQGIKEKNQQFAKRYADLDYSYNKDVRDIQRRVDAEKVTSGDMRKDYDEKMRKNEAIQHTQSRDTLLNQNIANTKFYNDKMTELKEDQQDELHQDRIRNADIMSKEKEAKTLALQEKDFKNKVTQDRASHNSNVRLSVERSENVLQRSKLENNKNTQINNLKSDFKKGIQKAHVATQRSMEEIKQESTMEKRELEKRLREQNSDTTTQLKDFHNSKYEIMKANLEKEIMSLKNDNAAIQRNANEMVGDIRTQSQADLERQIASSERKLRDLVSAERENSRMKEQSLEKTLREAQSEYGRKMSEIAHSNQVKIKQLSNTLVTEAKKDVAAQKEENQVQKRYFTREIERMNAASGEEREALISQYEDRMRQMQQVYAEKLAEIKNFNKLENA